MAKLTDEQVTEIRRLYSAGGISQYQLASQFSVSQPTIQTITSGKRWK